MKTLLKALFFAASLGLSGAPINAQTSSSAAAAQANNPLADIKAFNIQNYYMGAFTGPDMQFDWLVQAVKPETALLPCIQNLTFDPLYQHS